MPASVSWSEAAKSNLKHWYWFLAILAFEFWLASELPTSNAEHLVFLNLAADWLSRIAPVIHNFDKVAPNPRGLSLYFAVTTLAIIPKVAFFYLWINSSRVGMYRHFVISPLTTARPGSFKEFHRRAAARGDLAGTR